jgi:allantoicase
MSSTTSATAAMADMTIIKSASASTSNADDDSSAPLKNQHGKIGMGMGMHHSASITAVAEFNLEPAKNESPPSPFEQQQHQQQHQHVNLMSEGLGARVLYATDEWFATAECLLKDSAPIFDATAFCAQGKVMDGWETRRRREAGHDWCVVKLPSRASVMGIEIDTAHFTGNQVPLISLQVADLTCTEETIMVMNFPGALERLLHGGVQGTGATPEQVLQGEETCQKVVWKELLPKTPLRPGYEQTRMHYFTLETPMEGTHLRINYYPDGGVARMRLWGSILEKLGPQAGPKYAPIKTGPTCTVVSHSEHASDVPVPLPLPVPPSRQPYHYPELSLQENGGVGLVCSNKHYGHPNLLIQSNLGLNQGDGWETARHPDRPSVLVRDPTTNLVDSKLADWAVIKLGMVADGSGSANADGVCRVILDTKHFCGNYPESVQVEACYTDLDDAVFTADLDAASAGTAGIEWFPLVPRGRMAPDSEHVFESSANQLVNTDRKISHIKVSIYPDGGLSRVRVYGKPVAGSAAAADGTAAADSKE